MRAPLLILLFLMSAAIIVNGQDDKTFNQKADSTIQISTVKNGRSIYTRYTLNGVILTNSELEQHLMSYNQSAFEFVKYKNERKSTLTTGLIFGSVSIAAIAAAAIQANQQTNKTGSLFSRTPVFCSISIAGLIGEIIPLGRRNDHLNKALKAYNSRY